VCLYICNDFTEELETWKKSLKLFILNDPI